ncbi:MAG: SNF2-related protein [Saprospiraceae bacterium]
MGKEKREKTKNTSNSRKKSKKPKVKRVSYHRRPEEMDMRAWQIGLRRQYGESQSFSIENMGSHPVWSNFKVGNPEVGTFYKVALRSKEIGNNFCSCPDFKSNTLGICKHIEAVIHKLWHTRGMRKYFKETYAPEHSSVYLEYGEERLIKLRIGSHQQEALSQLAKGYFDEEMVLQPEAFARIEHFLEQARQLAEDFRCYPDALDFILEKREEVHRRQRMAEIAARREQYFAELLKVKLYPYQQEGILFAGAAGRCLIADEMGLGTTVQAIGAAELLRREFGVQRVLIVCPTSLKYQWQTEIEKFTDSSVQVIEGPKHKRKDQYKDHSFYQIISYSIATYDLTEIQNMDPDLIILDEAQRIKNWNTKISRTIKQIRTNYALVLTGTPLENKLEELYSIVQYVDNYLLGPVFLFLDRHQVKTETGQVVGYRGLSEIKEKLASVMIRRLKREVLKQLPGRIDKNLFVPMTEAQQEYHSEYSDAVARLVAKWRRYGFLREKDRQRLMINLNLMRMVCDSTYIVDQQTRHDTKILELLCILEEVLSEEGTKVVIFSQWQRMTGIVAEELEERGIAFAHLNGSVPSSERGALLDRFKNDPECVVFLSTDAGGVGLNLQSGSIVINLDLPWNPAVLEQRIARVHRMGQEGQVSVINFISRGTIEEQMLDKLTFKANVAAGVLDDGEDFIFMGGERFKEFMENVDRITQKVESQVPDTVTADSDLEEDVPGAAVGEEEPLLEQPDMDGDTEASEEWDDTTPEEPASHQEEKPAARKQSSPPATPQAAELVQMGASFFSALTQTLSDEKKTKELVSSIVKKDEQSGQTYLHIPVENEAIVQNALALIGGLVKQFGAGR